MKKDRRDNEDGVQAKRMKEKIIVKTNKDVFSLLDCVLGSTTLANSAKNAKNDIKKLNSYNNFLSVFVRFQFFSVETDYIFFSPHLTSPRLHFTLIFRLHDEGKVMLVNCIYLASRCFLDDIRHSLRFVYFFQEFSKSYRDIFQKNIVQCTDSVNRLFVCCGNFSLCCSIFSF